MRSDLDITNFTSGQLSPRMKGRIDHKAYFNGADTCQNFVVMPQGGVTARPGTQFVALARDQNNRARLIPFIFSTIQAYMLEFSYLRIRVYMNDGVVLSGGAPVDINTPYQIADLATLKFVQSADTLFIVHPNYPPATLTRSSHTSWTYSVMQFRDGPYLDLNSDTTNYLTPSGTTGSITLTWTNTVNLNKGAGLTNADIGRSVRVKWYGNWGWAVITGVSSATVATATVQPAVNNGAQAGLDGTTWAANTRYETNAIIANGAGYGGVGAQYYVAVSGGTSAASGVGPQGFGTSILDGSVIWSALGARGNASRLARTTQYAINDIVQSPTNDYFQAVMGGKTDSSTGAIPVAGGPAVQIDGTVQWTYIPPFTFPTKTLNWALGTWGGPNGYPFTVRFWQERLMFGGCVGYPSRVEGSQPNDFTNFAPSKADGTVLPSSGLDWLITEDQVNAIEWMIGAGSAQSMQLGIGTSGSEHILQAGGAGAQYQAATPTAVQSYQESTYGSTALSNPLRIGKSVLFMDRSTRKLREWTFVWQMQGYVGPDKLQLSENISRAPTGIPNWGSGLFELCYQQSPYQVIWCKRGDGALVSVTYDKDEEVFAPAVHQLGGSLQGGNPVVESLAIIPSQDGTYDELWLEVVRDTQTPNAPMRTIEVLTRYFDGGTLDEAFFVDCGLSGLSSVVNGTLNINGGVNQNPPTQRPSYTGNNLHFSSTVAVGWSVGDVIRANGGLAIIQTVTNTSDCYANIIRPMVSMAPVPPNFWSSATPKNYFTGLNHLIGQQVWLYGDGADLGYVTVDGSGGVTIPDSQQITYLTAGLLAQPVLITMPWEPQRAAGAASQGKMKDIDRLYARFHETRGAVYGRRTTDSWSRGVEDKLTTMENRYGTDPMDNAPPMQGGIFVLEPTQDYDLEGQIIFTRVGAAPMTVLSVFARGEVAEMPQP
jgi:hypothetical protein